MARIDDARPVPMMKDGASPAAMLSEWRGFVNASAPPRSVAIHRATGGCEAYTATKPAAKSCEYFLSSDSSVVRCRRVGLMKDDEAALGSAAFVRNACTVLFVERKLPWRVDQWLARRSVVQAYRSRRDARWERALFRPFVNSGALVFDIGANVGDKAAVFLSLGARVVCVEPDPRNIAKLESRFSTDVTRVAAGVGAAMGTCQLHLSPYTTRSTFVIDRMASLGDNCPFDESCEV